MPKRRRSQSTKRITQNVSTAVESQSPQLSIASPSRPRTRAWVRQEQQHDTTVANPSQPLRSSRRIAQKKSEALNRLQQPAIRDTVRGPRGAASHPRKQRNTLPKTAPPTKPSSRPTRKGRRPATEKPLQRRQGERASSPKVSAWLRGVEAVSSVHAPAARKPHAEDDMTSTSASKTTTNEEESTVKGAKSKAPKDLDKKLRYRLIRLDPAPDDRLAHLRSILKIELPKRPLKDTEDLQRLMRQFLQEVIDNSDDICYPYIDDFSFNWDEGKSRLNYPIVNDRYFQADLKRCLARNEAILQRTIMMHIIDQYWLGENFDWNCEGKWSQFRDNLLPSTKDDKISAPKPDLAISFTLQSFTQKEADSDPIPDSLERTISPDGGKRCFPFLFLEVKKAGADLQDANLTNLHNASQALYNMYTWMVASTEEKVKEFFRTARVFTLVLNAQDLSVRVHRPCQAEDGAISYRFDDFWPLDRYSRDQACQLIKTIINNYAAKELHGILKSAFIEVTQQEYERVKSKRKVEQARGSSKRARKGQDNGDQNGQSFGMSGLST